MDAYYMILQFDSLFTIISAITMCLLVILSVMTIRLNKSQRKKLSRLEKIINELEGKKT